MMKHWDYPEHTSGSEMAARIRQESNSLTADQRAELWSHGMKIIEGQPEDMRAAIAVQTRQLFEKINQTPALMSLLYDLNLLPEQVAVDSADYRRMLLIAAHWPERPCAKETIDGVASNG